MSSTSDYNEGSGSTMERSTLKSLEKSNKNMTSQWAKNGIFSKSDLDTGFANEAKIVKESLFEGSEGNESFRDSMRPLISPNEKDLNEDEKTEQNISDPFSRSSDTVKPSYMFHVNTRIWRNHLRLNYGLRISLILSIVVISLLTSFVKLEYENQHTGVIHRYNIGPVFISIDGTWHFIAEIYDCKAINFPGDFCERDYIDISIAAAIYNLGAFLVFIVYLASLVFPKRNIDRLNWLGLTATFLCFTLIILINNIFGDLAHGYYFLIVVIIVAVFTQSHFLYSMRKLRRNSLTNQLLEA